MVNKALIGPIMLNIEGQELTAEDREILEHPLVGGFILFARNYHSPTQITSLIKDVRKAARNDLLVAVDQEGGRVQRFREGFSRIPAMGAIDNGHWQLDDGSVLNCQQASKLLGHLMAREVQAVGVDISFAPVLDLSGISDVIGDRGFHSRKERVATLAGSFIDGMHQAGMKATGKHFPGHGGVKADSHFAIPIDERSQDEIFKQDLMPFKVLMADGKLDAMMPAHVIYPKLCERSVGFSSFWLQQVLRGQLSFSGAIFSDDLSMAAAASIGGAVERAEQAQQAGCDMLLLCNDRDSVVEVIDRSNIQVQAESAHRISQLMAQPDKVMPWQQLGKDSAVIKARQLVNNYWQQAEQD